MSTPSQIPTHTSLVGFFAGAPELHVTSSGTECCRARVGVEHYRKEIDGTFTRLDSTFHDIVMFDKAARETFDRFRSGDSFIASGHVREYEVPNLDGSVIREEFVARRIGHDVNRTTYEVTRRPKHVAEVTAPGTTPSSTPSSTVSATPTAPAPAPVPATSSPAVGL
jgi:single-strand DNA-binding protein